MTRAVGRRAGCARAEDAARSFTRRHLLVARPQAAGVVREIGGCWSTRPSRWKRDSAGRRYGLAATAPWVEDSQF